MVFNMVGGGVSLNYEILGGTSAPSNPIDNTLWINTDTSITSHEFNATEPVNPASGMVWIKVGTSSAVSFSVTEENPVIVYPVSAMQYIDGAWTDKTIEIYQGGAWKVPVQPLYIVKNGVPEYTFFKTFNNRTEQQNGCYAVYGEGGGYHSAWVIDMDLTYYNTLTIKGTFSAGEGFELCVWDNSNTEPSYTNHIATANLTETGATLDVSNVSGKCAVGITNVYTNIMKITEMILE